MSEFTSDHFTIAVVVAVSTLFVLVIANLIINRKKKADAPKELTKESIRETLIEISERKRQENLVPSKQKQASVEPVHSAGKTVAQTKVTEVKWFDRLARGLQRTRGQIVKSLDEFLLSKQEKSSQAEVLEHLFELLVQADVGVKTSDLLIDRVKARLEKDDYKDSVKIKNILREEIFSILSSTKDNPKGSIEKPELSLSNNKRPHVVLMVGVNGVGKTTTTGKLAYKAHLRGQKVVIGAADTFRAAAIEQLAVWATRSQAEMIRLKDGADPASVAFETAKKASDLNADVCLIDTAGRLQNRQDLMQELAKISRVVSKENPAAPHEVLLVLDATTGQNALQQAKIFKDVVNISGLVLTKLDGTAKGGIAIAIAAEMGIPIRYVGVGEQVEDLELFEAHEFVNALFFDQS